MMEAMEAMEAFYMITGSVMKELTGNEISEKKQRGMPEFLGKSKKQQKVARVFVFISKRE